MAAPLPFPQLSAHTDPLALGRIQILLVPVGKISPAIWEKWTTQINRYTEIRLGDVPGTSGGNASKADKARYLPPSTPPPNTHIHLSFQFTPPDNHILPLSLLQISAFPIAVIGLADLSDTSTNKTTKLWQFQQVLEEIGLRNANGTVFPLARRCFGVEEDVSNLGQGSTPRVDDFPREALSTPTPSGSTAGTPRRVEQSAQFEGVVEIDASDGSHLNGGSHKVAGAPEKVYDRKGQEEKMVIIPKDGNVSIVLGMLMADLVASILTEFGEIVTALETHAGTHTLQASMLPTLTAKSMPRPFTSSSSVSLGSTIARPHSANQSHIAISNNSVPSRSSSPAATSRPASVIGYNVGGGSSVVSISSAEGSTRPPSRPQSAIGSISENGEEIRGIGSSSSVPPPSKPDAKIIGNSIKRSSTGFSLSSSVGRVMGGGKTTGIDVVNTTTPSAIHSSNGTTSATGRLKKVQGDLWLLSGRLGEAITCYTEALTPLKTQSDHIWHGSACEGLATATLLEAWETRSSDLGTVPFLASPILSEAHDYLNQAYSLYGKASCPPESLFPHGSESGEAIIARLYSTVALKHARMLLYAWAAGGFGTAALQTLVSGKMPKIYPPMDYAHRRRVFVKLSTMSKISRSLVTRLSLKAHGAWLQVLPRYIQVAVLVDLAGVHRLLGLERKEAYFDSELVGMSVDSIGLARQRRITNDAAHRRDSIASHASSQQDSHTVTSPEDFDHRTERSIVSGSSVQRSTASAGPGFVTAIQPGSEEGGGSILALAERALDVTGFDVAAAADPPRQTRVPVSSYGWPELQVELVRQAVVSAEVLASQQSIMRYAAAALRSMPTFLSDHSQRYLYQSYARAWTIARRRGLDIQEKHWWIPDGIFTGFEIAPLSPLRLPYESRVGDLDHVATAGTGPFLYDPRAEAKVAGRRVLVQNEPIEFIVTLANPFSFDLDIQNLALVVDGVQVQTNPMAAVIPAETSQSFRLAAMASEIGDLDIKGLSVRLADGQEAILDLPQGTGAASRPASMLRAGVASKFTGSDLRASKRRSGVVSTKVAAKSGTATVVPCRVIEAQPLLRIRSSNLSHGSIIAHDGESSYLRLTVENVSEHDIDFVKLSFDDSLSQQTEKALAAGTSSAGAAYDLEADLVDRPIFRYEQADGPINIAARGYQTLAVRFLGKVGCETGNIHINYGQLPRNLETPQTFYTRRVSMPIIITVQAALRCKQLNLAPAKLRQRAMTDGLKPPTRRSSPMPRTPSSPMEFRNHIAYQQERQADRDFRREMRSARTVEEPYQQVTAVFWNPSDHPLRLHIERSAQDKGQTLRIARLMAPRSSERVSFPVQPVGLPESTISQPIPHAKTRQFVVNRPEVGITDDEEKQTRARFWIRKALLETFQAYWMMPGSNRSGEINLKQSHFASEIDSARHRQRSSISLTATATDGSPITDIPAGTPFRIHLRPRSFAAGARVRYHLTLPARISDDDKQTVAYTVSKEATDADMVSRMFVMEGKLSAEVNLQTDDDEISVDCIFLAKGKFRIRGTIQNILSDNAEAGEVAEDELIIDAV